MKRRLIALAIQGPSNRAMMMVSAARFAAISRRELVLCWHPRLYRYSVDDGVTLGCDWFDGPFPYGDFFDEKIEQIGLAEAYKLDWLPDSADHSNWDRTGIDPDDPRPDLVVSGWRMIHTPGEPDLEWIETATPAQREVIDQICRFSPLITPNRDIRAEATRQAEKLGIGRRTLGIQIRRQHDHSGLTKVSQFYEAAGELAKSASNCFVCSDHPPTEAAAVEWLRGLGFPATSRKRDGRGLWERTAAGDGLIDLLLLSYCGILIGSGGSSFSEQAWLLGGARDGAIKYVWPAAAG